MKYQATLHAGHAISLVIEKIIDRPTQTPLCGFTIAARKPLKFCSDEHVFERFSFYQSEVFCKLFSAVADVG